MGETVQIDAPPMPVSGAQRVAVLMLCLGEEAGALLMRDLEDAEIERVSRAMFALGPLEQDAVEDVLGAFARDVGEGGAAMSGHDTARRILMSFMPPEKVDALLFQHAPPRPERAPWRRLAELEGDELARRLAPEHPQTVAAILCNLPAPAAAAALPHLDEDRIEEVIERMVSLGPLPEPVLDDLEHAVAEALLGAGGAGPADETAERMADVLSALDPAILKGVEPRLQRNAPVAFGSIRKRMFTFDDVVRIDRRDLAHLLREVPADTLAPALAGAPAEVRDHVLGALPARARDMLTEEIDARGEVQPKDVRAAQDSLVESVRDLIRAGEIELRDPPEERAPT